MGLFLLGIFIGIFIGANLLAYMIVDINTEDPDRFDRIIAEMREKIKNRKNN